MANEDFYLTFGSNATAWASSLKGQLKPAYDEIAALQHAIEGLQSKAASVSGPLTTELAKSLDRAQASRGGTGGQQPGTGTGGGGGGAQVFSSLERAANAAQSMTDQLYQSSDELGVLIRNMSAAALAIKSLPETTAGAINAINTNLANTVKSFNKTLTNIENRAAGRGAGQAVTTGQFAGSGPGVLPPGIMDFAMLARQAINGGSALPSLSTTAAPPAAIQTVPQQSIDNAATDRIVAAIQEQTRALIESGGGPRRGKVRKGGTEETDVQTEQATTQTPAAVSALEKAKSELHVLDEQLAAALTTMTADDKELIDKVRGIRTAKAAEVAALERQSDPAVSKGDQSAARRAAAQAERDSLEPITKEERDRRLGQLTRIGATADPNFTSNVGRGQLQFGMADLKKMASALGEAGFPVASTSRTRMPELAQMVHEQGLLYSAQYPKGTFPDALNPRGKIIPGPSVSKEAQEFLGPLNEWLARLKALQADARSGGQIPDELPLAVSPKSGRSVLKGRLGSGAATLGFEGMSPLSSGATPEEITRIRELMQNPTTSLSTVRDRISRNPNFNPYDASLQSGVGIKGNDDEAKASRMYLHSIKAATDHLDSLADEYALAQKAIAENNAFLQRAADRAKRGTSKGTDEQKILDAEFNKHGSQRVIDSIDPADQFMFGDPGFQAGKAQRDAARAEQDRRRKELEAQRLLADHVDGPANGFELRDSARTALIGRRFALNASGQASSDFIKAIPGLIPASKGRLSSSEGLSRDDDTALNKAFSGYASALRKAEALTDSTGARKEGVSEEDLVKAETRLESAATKMANTLERLFGRTHSIETLTGRPLQTDAGREAEERLSGYQAGPDLRAGNPVDEKIAAAVGKELESSRATEQKTTATKKVTAELNSEITALKEERKQLQSGLHTRKDRDKAVQAANEAEAAVSGRAGGALKAQITKATNKGDTDAAAVAQATLDSRRKEAQAAREAAEQVTQTVARLKTIRQRLGELGDTGGSGAGGGKKPPVARGGADDGGADDNNILRQMLTELKGIRAALRGTIKISGTTKVSGTQTTAPDGTVTTTGTTTTRKTAPKSPTQEEAATLQAIAREREAQTTIERSKQRIEQADERQIRISKERSDAATKASRDEALAIQRVEAAMNTLSDRTKSEIAELERLHAAGAGASDIVRQQVKVYGGVAGDLDRAGINAGGQASGASAILNAAGPRVDAGQLGTIKKQSELLGQQAASAAQNGASKLFGPQGFWGRLLNTGSTFVVRNFAAGLVFGLTNELQSITEQAIQTEATFVRVSSALEATGKDVGSLRSDLSAVSTDYGTQLNDVYDTAAALTGLFDNTKDLAAGTRIVAQLQAISDGALNAQEAVGVLASTMSAFQRQAGEKGPDSLFLPGGVEGIQKIADVFTVIQNNLGVNIENTAEGVSALAGQAKQMKLSFEETAVFVAQISKQTNQTGAGAGEQLSRILASLQSGRAKNSIGQVFGDDKAIQNPLSKGDYGTVLTQMIGKWGTLNESQKSNLATTIAGQRQARAFFALMNNGQATLTLLAKAHDSTGAAQARMEAIMATLNKRLAQFRTELQNLASNLVRSGILNFLGVMLVATTKLLELLNKLLGGFNNLADHNGFIDFLRKTTTLLVGAGLAVKGVTNAIVGLRAAMAARSGQQAVSEGETLFSSSGNRPGTTAGLAAETRLGLSQAPGYRGYGVGAARAAGADIADGRRTAPLTRAVGFGFDRTIGVGLEATAKGYNAAIGKAAASMGQSSNLFVRKLGETLVRDAAALDRFAAGSRVGFQSAGSGRFSPVRGLRGAEGTLDSAAQAQFFKGADLRKRAGAGVGADAALLKQAESAEKMGRSLTSASSVTGKVAGGLERLAASGALADGALIAVGVGLSAWIGYLQDAKAAQEVVNNAVKAAKPDNTHKTAAEIAAAQYSGPSDQAFKQQTFQDPLAAAGASGFAGVEGKFGLGLKGIGGVIGGGPSTWLNPMKGLSRAFGTDGSGETYGLSQANDIVKKVQSQLADAGKGNSLSAVTDIQEAASKELDKMLLEASANDSLSSQQKEAVAANVDQARTLLTDAGTNAAAGVEGLAKTQILLDDQIEKLQTALSLLQTTQGRTSIQGLDLSGFYTGIEDDIGATGKLKDQLDQLMFGNLDAVDQQIQLKKILKLEVKNLQAKLASQLASPNVNTEDIDKTKGQIQSALGQLAGTGQSIQQAIFAAASTTAGLQNSQGNFAGSMNTYSNALRRAHHQFLVDQGLVGGAAKNIVIAYRGIGAAAAGIDRDINIASRAGEFAGFTAHTHGRLTGAQRDASKTQRAAEVAYFKEAAEKAIAHNLAALDREIAQAVNPAIQAALTAKRAQLNSLYIDRLNQGQGIPGVKKKDAENYGNAAFDWQEVNSAQNDAFSSANSAAESEKQAAATARQNAASIRQARLGIAAAWADARGDAVASARIQVQMAAAQIAAAKADMAAASTADEKAQATVSLYTAEAAMIAAHAQVASSQADLISSQYDVSIALADAAGHTVEAARRRMAQARAALGAALKRSGGKNTAEVNQARASAISAEAAVRDARLQDELDTIDFNLQMGKITQSSAIAALQHILKTEELTKAQRRQLLLQIKGMKDELADSQWNFGDIKLPTPYQMRRYIEQRRTQFRNQMDAAAGQSATKPSAGDHGAPHRSSNVSHQTTTITIDGADVGMVKRIIKEVVGGQTNVRTTGPRRGGK